MTRLVSTAGSLLARRDGPQIDAHDLVVRTGSSPVRGYETHVGSRTSMRYAKAEKFDSLESLVRSEPATQYAWLLDEARDEQYKQVKFLAQM